MNFSKEGIITSYSKMIEESKNVKKNLKLNFKDADIKFKSYINQKELSLEKIQEAKAWFNKKSKSIYLLFEYSELRNLVFSKFSKIWLKSDKTTDQQIYALITQVSIANAVLAGLPGKLGIGVIICIALEFYMAISIARRIGFKISDDDLWAKFKDLSKLGLYFTFVAFIAIYAFKHMLGFVFSLIPGVLPQIVIAEYIVTMFVGVLFFQAFEQTSEGSFFCQKIIQSSFKKTKELFSYQKQSIQDTFSKENLQETGNKVWAWFNGDFVENLPKARGDVFFGISFSLLISGQEKLLDGPLGKIFVDSIRDRWPDLSNASVGEISEFMNRYSQEQIPGVLSTIKGKFFERLVEHHENNDGDEWKAVLHEDESFPGTDIVLTNLENDDVIELSLKASDNFSYIEDALLKYPDSPILVTNEIAGKFEDLDQVIASEFSNLELKEITEKNFEELVNNLTPIANRSVAVTSSIGVAMATVVTLWPFVIAYLRKKIDFKMLQRALEKVFPKAGKELAYKLTFSVVFGPIYGWYVLASTVMDLTPSPKREKRVLKLEYTT